MKEMKLSRVLVKNNRGQFAVCLRDFSVGKNYAFKGVVAQLPGGKVEEGETFLVAARKELSEEIGLYTGLTDLEMKSEVRIGTVDGPLIVQFFICHVSGEGKEIAPEEAHKFKNGKLLWVDDVHQLAKICGENKWKVGYGIYDFLANLE